MGTRKAMQEDGEKEGESQRSASEGRVFEAASCRTCKATIILSMY